MNQQITDEEYQMTKNINGLNVTITVTQTDHSNNQPDMNMQINSQQINELPIIQSFIINNQNVLIQNNNQFENQPNNCFFNHRKIVIKSISEIKQDNVKGETLRQQIKRQDYEQNIRIIANQKQNIKNLYREINNLKEVIKKKDEQIKECGQNDSNEYQQKIISPLIKRPKIKILDEQELKPKKINQFRTRTLNLAKSTVNNAQSSRQDLKIKTQLNPINSERSLVNYEQGFFGVFKKKNQLKKISSIIQKNKLKPI